MNRSFWHGRRVFVSGHTGFKGSWLCLWLSNAGAKLSGFALPPSAGPSLFKAARVEEVIFHHTLADVRNSEELKSALQRSEPEIVFHMAAQPLVQQSYVDPVQTYSTNVLGTVNLFEAVRTTASVKVVINVTTDKCYANTHAVWGFRETDILGGHDPYSSSKACAELITDSYRRSFFSGNPCGVGDVAIASARAGNVIGGGDWAAGRLVPDVLKSFLENTPLLLRNPDAVRPWQHVLDPLHGYMLLAERLSVDGRRFAEAWNFGPTDDDARSVRSLVAGLAKRWGPKATWHTDLRSHPYEAPYLKLETSKARMRLGWKPALSFDMALDWVIDWMRMYSSGYDMRSATLSQIDAYERLIQSNA